MFAFIKDKSHNLSELPFQILILSVWIELLSSILL